MSWTPDAGFGRSPGRRSYEASTFSGVPGATPGEAVAVSTVVQTTRRLLENAIEPLWVRGEVADFKAARNGHWYFALRDSAGLLPCVVWASDQPRIVAAPDDGMQVVAFGQVSVYPARGTVQLQVRAMRAEGDGLYEKAKRRTIERLTLDGLLAPDRKRALPARPRCVAVVTSPDGAAMHDIVAVIRRRSPGVQIVLVGTRVQGDGAAEEIRLAIHRVHRWGQADVVIIGRGGGARDDLWAFNDERVARAVAACRIPTISAVGHEVDTTVCDMVADWRAATPSAAAEAAVPAVPDDARRLKAVATLLRDRAERRVRTAEMRLTDAARHVRGAALHHLRRHRSRIEAVSGHLHALSPLATLSRGFAVARTPEGAPLTSVGQFSPGAPFMLSLRDGTIKARSEEVEAHDVR